MTGAWETGSFVLGALYILAWSVSFYPQLILNYRRGSVSGLSLDFLCLNVLGFLCYSVYTVVFLAARTVQDQYRHRHPGSAGPLVRTNDALFALHALLLSVITLSQVYCFGFARDPGQRVSRACKLFLSLSVVLVASLCIVAQTSEKLEWIDVIYLLSYIKLLVSLVKFLPQLKLNYQRKSTVGWSITNILLDFTGGTLSLLHCALANDWSAVTGNAVKTLLGFLAIFFDSLFVLQHYVLYRGNPSPTSSSSSARNEINESSRLLD